MFPVVGILVGPFQKIQIMLLKAEKCQTRTLEFDRDRNSKERIKEEGVSPSEADDLDPPFNRKQMEEISHYKWTLGECRCILPREKPLEVLEIMKK